MEKTEEADRCNAGTVRVGQRALAHAGANLLAINAPSQPWPLQFCLTLTFFRASLEQFCLTFA
jgi:hypothetical protein